MRIFAEKGRNDILFQFTEHKFENKYKKFFQYSKTFINKFFKRKDKISGVYIDYTWGYKTKEPGITFTRHVFPPDMEITKANVLRWAFSDMEEKHNQFVEKSDPEEEQIYHLREIDINFIYT
jgi:hypothetical protein